MQSINVEHLTILKDILINFFNGLSISLTTIIVLLIIIAVSLTFILRALHMLTEAQCRNNEYLIELQLIAKELKEIIKEKK